MPTAVGVVTSVVWVLSEYHFKLVPLGVALVTKLFKLTVVAGQTLVNVVADKVGAVTALIVTVFTAFVLQVASAALRTFKVYVLGVNPVNIGLS